MKSYLNSLGFKPNIGNDIVPFKDTNYFSSLADKMPKLILIENIGNEKDKIC